MRKASASRYWVFRGTAGEGRTVAWGTTAARAAAGAVLPLLMEPPGSLAVGPSLTVGEPPPAVSTTLSLADPDGEIVASLLPDRRGRQGLTGRVYVGVVEGESLAIETPVTPVLHVAGSIQHEDGITTVTMQSDDSPVLGRSVALWTVAEVLAGKLLAIDPITPGGEERLLQYLAGRPMSDLIADARAALAANEATVVPWVYEPAIVDLMPLTDAYPRIWVGGMQQASMQRSWSRLIAEADGVLSQVTIRNDVLDAPLEFIAEMELRDDLGALRQVAVRFFVQPEQPEHVPSRYLRTTEGWGASPAKILREIITDHAAAGASGVDAASWAKVEAQVEAVYGGACGGIFGSEGATIREVIQHIAPICGMRVWLGPDDRLHAGLSGYSYQDSQDAQGTLVSLEEGDAFPRDLSGSPAFSSEVVGDPDDDAAGVARVSIEWLEDQRSIYPLETASSAPVLGDGPGDADRERVISGAWIVPARGADVAGGIQAGMAADAARVQIATHLGAHTLAPGQMVRVSHPRGLGLPGLGWERRLTRVDRVEVMPGEDSARLTLTDLGLSERMRLGLLDTVQQWLLFLGKDGADLEIDDYGDGKHHLIKGVLDVYDDVPWDDGAMCIWTPGAEEAVCRRSWRVLRREGGYLMVDGQGVPPLGTVVPVDSQYEDPIIESGWAVVRTDLLDSFYREDFIRSADKDTGLLESGRQGFQYSAY